MADQERSAPRWISGIEPAPELLAATGTKVFEIECRQQPSLLKKLIGAYASDNAIREQIKVMRSLAAKEGPVLFLGMGASLCSSVSGSVHMQSHGRSSFSIDAGEWLHYGMNTWTEAALSVLLTTSGESAELVELMKRRNGSPLGLICNNAASTCWRLAENRLPILAGPEYGNATKTYINAAAASIILSSEILGISWHSEADYAADIFSSSLEQIFAIRSEIEEFCRGAANIEIIGRGSAYGGAVMSALCIREMSGCRAAAHTGAGFRHGPNLDVDSTHLAIIFALGRVAELGLKLAKECNRRGGKVLLIAEQEHERTDVLFSVKIDAVPEPWEGITSLLGPQALTLAMIERTGCRLPPRFQYGVMEQ